jgi:hypothetical protein
MTTVDKDIVAKYYIECELDNIVTGENFTFIKNLSSSNRSRLLEALSFTYRANDVFDYVESDQYTWKERTVSIDDITLTGMSSSITKVIYSDEVQQNPHKLIEFISKHPGDERFDEIQLRDIPENRRTLLLREKDGTIKMLDGSHRFLAMAINGETSFHAYVATIAGTSAKQAIGDTVFLRMRRLWQTTNDPDFKTSIEKTVVGMIRETSNGAHSVQTYWIEVAPTQEVKAAGERLLKEVTTHQQPN